MKGEEMRRLRKRMGLTQEKLGEKIGVAENTIARWERNEMKINEPAARLLRTIAGAGREKKK